MPVRPVELHLGAGVLSRTDPGGPVKIADSAGNKVLFVGQMWFVSLAGPKKPGLSPRTKFEIASG
jgi:hypothetical protein